MYFDIFTWIGVAVILYYLFYIIFLFFHDSDFTLAYAERFGKPLHELNGKVIWITGASSGIGEHLAYSCAKVGSKLVLSARRANELERVKQSCIAIGKIGSSDILLLPMDVSDLKSHETLFNQVINHFGKLDILVNNAGRSQRAIWEDIDINVDKTIFDLNVFGVIHLTRICVKYFLQKGSGHVAVTSSGAGIIGVPFSGSYTGSKHAIHGYFNSLRAEKFFKNITVTVFCPGPTFTNFLKESFTSKVDEKFGEMTQTSDRRMTGERCGHLFAIALANKLDEAWASINPLLFLYYLNCYHPFLLKRVFKFLGPKGVHRLRDSRDSIKSDS